jgi:hypothetical protein
VIEDAALHHSSCYRDTPGTATCVVTVDGGGHVGAISGISDADGTYINGEGVYLEQGAHIGAEGTVTVVGGEITAVTLDSHGGATGSGYAAGACTIRKNAWLNQAIDIVDWILTNCATNGVSPRIVLCSGWWETAGDANPAQTMLVDGVSDTFAGHVARTFRGPEYSGLVRVVNTEPLGRVVGNVRITDEATVDGAYWTPNNPPSWASLPASTLYIVWYLDEDYVDVVDSSLVVGWDPVLRRYEVADDLGAIGAGNYYRLAQSTLWYAGGAYPWGDNYHPNDVGMDAIADAIFGAVSEMAYSPDALRRTAATGRLAATGRTAATGRGAI